MRKQAAELAALRPDVIVSAGATSMGPVIAGDPDIPIVFVNVADPVGAGYAESLARPGGNATGFMAFEYSLSGNGWNCSSKSHLRWRGRGAPGCRDNLRHWPVRCYPVCCPVIEIDVSPIGLRDAARSNAASLPSRVWTNGGLIVTASAAAVFHRDLIIKLAARYKLPAVYSRRLYVTEGGLISYGSDIRDQFRRAASYVDRILKGEKPADLPVQAPNKYEL